MSNYFMNDKFYPQHFIIQNILEDAAIDVSNSIAKEAKSISSDSFNGKVDCFKFDFRYCPPYEHHNFHELERLQVEAIGNVRFKNDYYGYALLDITEWNGHMEEDLFSKVTAAFLSYKSDHWKYVFYSSKPLSEKEVRLLNDIVWCRSLSEEEISKNQIRFDIKDKLSTDFSIHIDSFTAFLLTKIISENGSENTVKKIIEDFVLYFGTFCFVNKSKFKEYLMNPMTYMHSLIDHKKLTLLMKEQKEVNNSEH